MTSPVSSQKLAALEELISANHEPHVLRPILDNLVRNFTSEELQWMSSHIAQRTDSTSQTISKMLLEPSTLTPKRPKV